MTDTQASRINLPRLAKVWALTASSNRGEAAAAREQARRIVQRAGKTLDDVPGLLGQAALPPKPAPFAFVDIGTPEGQATWATYEARRKLQRDHTEAPERADVLRRYGTEEAVLAWTVQERQLRAAVSQWATFQGQPPRWTLALDGWTRTTLTNPSPHVMGALARAYPMPGTIAEAAAEYATWQRRDRDLGLVLGDTQDSQLDLPAYLRRQIVERLLATGLRAGSVAEVLARQRYLVDLGESSPEIEQAVLLDLEGLADTVGPVLAPVQTGHASTPSARRAEVLRLLSNLDTAGLPDREIARRAGVSPQTVGNLRRKRAT